MAGENDPVVEQPIVAAPELTVAADAPVVVADAPVADAPVVADAPAADAPAESKPATVADTPSLLEEAAAPDGKPKPADAEGEKPAEEAKPADEKPAEEKPAEKPADADAEKAEADKPKEEAAAAPEVPPVEYKFELPENVTLPDERKTELFGVLDAFRADPSNMQPLIDFHVAEVNRQSEHLAQQQHDVFNDTRKTWRDQIKSDEEMGGSGFQTTVKAVARARDALVSSHPEGSPEYIRQHQEANEFFRITGAGDHPVLWRMLHNATRFLDEAKPLPTDVSPAPQGRQPGSKRGLLYNHPTSPNNKGSA